MVPSICGFRLRAVGFGGGGGGDGGGGTAYCVVVGKMCTNLEVAATRVVRGWHPMLKIQQLYRMLTERDRMLIDLV